MVNLDTDMHSTAGAVERGKNTILNQAKNIAVGFDSGNLVYL